MEDELHKKFDRLSEAVVMSVASPKGLAWSAENCEIAAAALAIMLDVCLDIKRIADALDNLYEAQASRE
jgi:hypothetical protein